MKQRLTPGAEIDVLTESELTKALGEILRGKTDQPAQVRDEQAKQTDAAGGLELVCFTVPPGMGFYLNRLLVRADGFTAAIPFTGAGAMLEVLRDDTLVDFKSLVAAAAVPAGLPALLSYGTDSAAWFSNGSQVKIRITAGPALTNIVARISGILSPVVVGN